ncbi:hypothetical protein [Pontibacter amylolyticus]|nr:hypothetical protein [Pontibacter amylolyticus]
MENKMNYTKAILLIVSGIISIVASLWLGAGSETYGFLIGYGYTALVGGVLGMGYSYFKKQGDKKKTVVR